MKKEFNYLCKVDAEHFIAAENEYHTTIRDIADLKRNQHEIESKFRKFRPLLIWGGKILSLLGIALGILMLLPFGVCKTDYFTSILLLIFFILGFLFFKDEKKISNTLWSKTNKLVSDIRAEHTFKIARRLVPFEANYRFEENILTYSRIKDGNELINWSKTIEGQYYIGKKFIITYKNKSLFPHLFLFIRSSDEISSYFTDIGMKQIKLME